MSFTPLLAQVKGLGLAVVLTAFPKLKRSKPLLNSIELSAVHVPIVLFTYSRCVPHFSLRPCDGIQSRHSLPFQFNLVASSRTLQGHVV